MRFPKLKALRTKQELLDVFRGYDRNVRIREGAFRDMRNLTGEHYPVMAVRQKRRTVMELSGNKGEVTALLATDRNGFIYTQGTRLHHLTSISGVDMGLSDEAKQLVRIGSYLIILPDMQYFNLEDTQDFGPIGHSVEVTAGEVSFELCDVNGEAYGTATISDTAPASPANKALWIDTSLGEKALKQYSKNLDTWMAIERTYVKISGLNGGTDGQGFSQYDGVTISGITATGAQQLNGRAVLQTNHNSSSIVIEGMVEKTLKQTCTEENPLRVERAVPVMDCVIEVNNRLWGCRYGLDAQGKFVNKLYASKLGDFRNWECFMGLASDSWECEVGSQGTFTGAANVAGYPMFYKQDMRHKVWISDSGAHQVTATPCQGVKYGCGGSVATMDGAAIFKSLRGFCMDDGSGPEEIGACFAGETYSHAMGCVCGHKYYVSMEGEDGSWHLFVYDADKKLWHREDEFHAVALCGTAAVVLAVAAGEKKLVDMTSGTWQEGRMEDDVSWMAETGEIGLEDPGRKYLTRLNLRLSMEVGSELTVYALYDTDQEWVALGSIRGTGLQSFSLPLPLRRCDHLRLRLEGVGDVKLYSVTKTIQEGSEYP